MGDPYAPWVTVKVPEAAPKADGEKTTLIEQVKPAARVFGDIGQLFVSLKFPVTVIELMVRAAFSPFRRVKDFVALFPKVTLPKERGLGERVTGLTPVPLKLILCGLLETLSAMEIDPVVLPVLAGLKTTLIVQCAFGANAAGASGQLLLSEKGEGALGGVILEITRGAVPVLVRRADLTELVVPTA